MFPSTPLLGFLLVAAALCYEVVRLCSQDSASLGLLRAVDVRRSYVV